MPNYSNPTHQRQGMPMHGEEKHHMSMAEKKNELRSLLDDVCTYLSAGSHWHNKAAQCSWLMAIRGYGRIHELQGIIDEEDLVCLRKLCTDKLKHIAVIDMDKVAKAEAWEMHDINGFRAHFKTWDEREERYMDCINEAIHYARKINIEIYEKLVCIAKRVQNEIFRVGAWYDRHELGGWRGDDIAYVSEIVHEHVESGNYDRMDTMDINVG